MSGINSELPRKLPPGNTDIQKETLIEELFELVTWFHTIERSSESDVK